MTANEQLTKWAAGESVHNKEGNECCPDFSCCEPTLLWPRELREQFLTASDDERHRLLMMSLGQAASALGKSVYVAGGIEE